MRTQAVQRNSLSRNFTGFLKPNKSIVKNEMYNPAKVTIKEIEAKMQQHVSQLGITVIKKVTLFLNNH